ncbi:MAG: hypothetical protein FWE61_05835 [Micrococcales bacterium]|nr:hypothetical protein [Micrococcales bacterium]
MINGYEIVVLLVIVAVVVGPARLPGYAKELAALVRRGRELLRSTQDRVSAELGDAGQEVDWAALDPRRYDPRRIVRDALADPLPPQRRRRARTVRDEDADSAETNSEQVSTGADLSGPGDGTTSAGPHVPDAAGDQPTSDEASGQDGGGTGPADQRRGSRGAGRRGPQRASGGAARRAQVPPGPPVFDDEAT